MAWSMGSKWVAGYLKFFNRSDGRVVGGFNQSGPTRKVTRVGVSAQNATLLAATVASGLLDHTSAVGGGTLTLDTGANMDTQFPETQVNETIECYYYNSGTQTVTIASAAGTTVLGADPIATLQGRKIIFLKTAAATYSVFTV